MIRRLLLIFTIFTVFGIGFLMSRTVTEVQATHTNKEWIGGSWGACVSKGPQCGTDNGTQSRTLTCTAHTGGNDNCSLGTLVPATYTCDVHAWIHSTFYDVSAFYNKPTGDDHHCHRIVWGDLGTTKQGSFKAMHHNDHDYGSPDHGNWESAYNNHIDQNPEATVDVAEHYVDPETKTETQDCHTGIIDNSACTPTDVCKNIDGNQATVPANYYAVEGNCYAKTPVCTDDSANNFDNEVSGTEYSNNEVCTYPTHRWCTLQEDESYLAQAIPNNQENPEGKPWETGMDRYCLFTEAGKCPTDCGHDASEVADGKGGTIQCEATAACTEPTPTPTPNPDGGRVSGSWVQSRCDGKIDARMNLTENGKGIEAVTVHFKYMNETKDVNTNSNGEANVGYDFRGEGNISMTADGWPGQEPPVWNAKDCGKVLGVTTGRVLGVSTMAGTGVFADSIASISGLFGMMLTAVGLRRYGKKN